jgi:DNA-binding CsgD family transcriptional regulator/PAS domain-containing protein
VVDDRRILNLIDEIYDASLDAGRWPTFIESLSGAFNCVGGALLQRDRHCTERGFIEFGGMAAATRIAYQQYYAARSVWMPAAFTRSSDLVIGHELAPDKRSFERSEFYNDWLRPQGAYDAIGGVIQRSADSLTVVTVLRAKRMGLVTEADKQAFARLMPHVRRAMDIYRRLFGVQLQRDGTLYALDALQVGILLTDRTGRVMFANRVAEEILRRGDGLALFRGQLRAAKPDDSLKLLALIEGAVKTTLGAGEKAGGILSLPTSIGDPITLLVSPCPRLGLLEPAAIVFITASPRSVSFEGHHVARRYGLTPAEMKLLRALVDGCRLSEYAGDAAITLNTAKTHLKQIFAKTGSRRQSDLIRLFVADPILRLAERQPKI